MFAGEENEAHYGYGEWDGYHCFGLCKREQTLCNVEMLGFWVPGGRVGVKAPDRDLVVVAVTIGEISLA